MFEGSTSRPTAGSAREPEAEEAARAAGTATAAVPLLDREADGWSVDPWTEFCLTPEGIPTDVIDSSPLTVPQWDRERWGAAAVPRDLVPRLPGQRPHPLQTEPVGGALATAVEVAEVEYLPDAALVDLVAACERLKGWVESRALAATAELVERCSRLRGVGPGGPEAGQVAAEVMAAAELAPALRVSPSAAAWRVALAQGLRRLPETRAALASGLVDVATARAVMEAVEPLDTATARTVERHVLARAGSRSRSGLRSALRRAVIAADTTAAERRVTAARLERGVWRDALEDGMAQLTYVGPVEAVEATYQWVSGMALVARHGDRARARLQRQAGTVPDPVRTLAQARADVLGDLGAAGLAGTLLWRLSTGDPCGVGSPDSTGDRGLTGDRGPQIQVVVAASTLLGADDEPAELVGVGPLSAAAARAVAAEGTWRRLLVEPGTTRLLDMSTQTYRPPESMRAFLTTRDRTCRGPGCRMPAAQCDLDHTTAWPCGPTCPANLCALCRTHHRIKTLTDTRVRGDGHGGLTWIMPSGKTYHRPADPVLDHPALRRPGATHVKERPPHTTQRPPPDDDVPPF